MPLKLSLKPGEKFVLNGAVVVNGDKRSSMIIQNQASILRERDIMQQEAVDTPAKRIYFPIMMMYLDDQGRQDYYDEFVIRMTEMMNAIMNPEIMALCLAISRDVIEAEYYPALSKCRQLIEYEKERLADVSSSVSDHPEGNRESA